MKKWISFILMIFGVGLLVSLTYKFISNKNTNNSNNSQQTNTNGNNNTGENGNTNSNSGSSSSNNEREIVGYKHSIEFRVDYETYEQSALDPVTGVGSVTTNTILSHQFEFEIITDTTYDESFGSDDLINTGGLANFISYLGRNQSEDIADYSFHLVDDNINNLHASGLLYEEGVYDNPPIYYVVFAPNGLLYSINNAASVNDLQQSDFILVPSNGQTINIGSESATVVYYFTDTLVTPIYAS